MLAPMGQPTPLADLATLAFYDRESALYAARKSGPARRLTAFLAHLAPGAKILELGCGSGHEAEAMIAAGFAVTPTDGSPGLAEEAEARLGVPVRVMRFDQLPAGGDYDAVWANACLLHVPEEGLADILERIRGVLRPGGLFYASYKLGDGGGRDRLGRYNNFPRREVLLAAYAQAGPWRELLTDENQGGGYDGVERTWIHIIARS
jgi:SAM-dependent methyltransferase